MSKLYLFKCLFLFMVTLGSVFSQDGLPDNKGKEFWLMFNQNNNNFSLTLRLFITGDQSTSGTVILPTGDPLSFTVSPGEITTLTIPSILVAAVADGIENKGIQIVAEDEITVYGLNQKQFTTDAYLALPKDVLGVDYLAISYPSLSNQTTLASMIGIVATEDNTIIDITPNSNTSQRIKGVTYQITLNKGQSYQLIADVFNGDLSGSRIVSNHPISVFSGHTCANVPIGIAACDHMVEQIPPVSSFGQSFVTIPLATRRGGDIFRIVSSSDNTNVSVSGNNGFVRNFSLDFGEFMELDIPSNTYTRITSDNAILVAQYSKGQNSDGVISDPFMMLIPPFEQFQNNYTVGTPSTGFNRHFINLAVPNSEIDKILLDGNLVPSTQFTAIPDTNFSGAQVEVSAGTHNLEGNLPFGAFMYGFGSFDSYGYPGGQALARVEQVREISLDLQPEILLGSTYCFKGIVTDEEGNPVFGARVDFEVEGVNPKIGFGITNESGRAEFCFDALNEGVDMIFARIGNLERSTSVTTSVPRPTTINFIPPNIVAILGEEVCVRNVLMDQFGQPLSGQDITVLLEGVQIASGTTEETGFFDFCFTPDQSGELTLSSSFEGSEAFTVTFEVEVPASAPSDIQIEPETSSILFNEEICVTATVLDQFGHALEGVEVFLEINGQASGSAITDEDGVAEFCETFEIEDQDGQEGDGQRTLTFYFEGGSRVNSVIILNRIPTIIIPVPTFIKLGPVVDLTIIGEQVCFDLEVLDQFNNAIEGVEISFSDEQNVLSTADSDAGGKVQFCLTTQTLGEVSYGFNFAGGQPIAASFNVVPMASVASLIVVEPIEVEIEPGSEICINILVQDQFNNPLEEANFFIELDGELVDEVVSGQDGEYQYCFLSTAEGQFTFGFYIEGGEKVFSIINVVDILPIPTILNVSLSEDQIQVGEELCLAVTVLDQFGLPVVGADVTLDVNGVFYGRGITDENGRLDFCITPDETGMLVFDILLDDLQESVSVLVTDESSDEIAIKAFALVDADKNQIIREIKEGDVLLFSEVKDLSLNLVAIADPEIVGSVWIEMESRTKCETCPSSKTGRVENVIPYSLFGDINSNYNGRKLSPGEYSLLAIPYSESNRKGDEGLDHTVNFSIKYDVDVTSFVLVDSHTNQDIQLIQDGDVLDLAKLGDIRFNIRGEGNSTPVGAIKMELEGPINFSIFERVAPYALFGDNNGNYSGRKLPVGKYTLKAKAYPNPYAGNSGFGGEIATIQFEVISGIAVESYTLVNADTNEDIMELIDQDVLDLKKYGDIRLSIRANTVGDGIQSVVMMLSGPIRTTIRERIKPYALFGDLPVNYYNGRQFHPGNYELTSTPYDRDNQIGGAKTIRFSAKYVENGDNLRVRFAEQVLEGKDTETEEILEPGKLSIYPQPSNGIVNFIYPSELAENTSLQIIDSQGRIIYGGVIGQTPAFDFRNYGSGLYLLIIYAENEPVKHKIIIH